jgi:hypothetical protein
MPSDAVSRIFTIAQLVDHIFSFVHEASLLRIQRVCTAFKARIASNIAIQKRLFLRDDGDLIDCYFTSGVLIDVLKTSYETIKINPFLSLPCPKNPAVDDTMRAIAEDGDFWNSRRL